jgi:hypothetical protein
MTHDPTCTPKKNKAHKTPGSYIGGEAEKKNKRAKLKNGDQKNKRIAVHTHMST